MSDENITDCQCDHCKIWFETSAVSARFAATSATFESQEDLDDYINEMRPTLSPAVRAQLAYITAIVDSVTGGSETLDAACEDPASSQGVAVPRPPICQLQFRRPDGEEYSIPAGGEMTLTEVARIIQREAETSYALCIGLGAAASSASS